MILKTDLCTLTPLGVLGSSIQMIRKIYTFFGITILIGVSNFYCTPSRVHQSKQLQGNDLTYLGVNRPGNIPEVFASGMISKPDRHEFGCTFSRDGRELYFGVDNDGIMEIYGTRLENGFWTSQKKLFQGDTFSYNDPMFSPDDKRLYFISNRPLEPPGAEKDVDIWFIERDEGAWSSPMNLGPVINSYLNEYFVSFADDGTLYFASKDKAEDAPRYAYDIYRAELTKDRYGLPQKLPEAINTNRYEADVCVAPDESYLIFCSIRRDGYGMGDLYISFRNSEGSWTSAVNMGYPINTDQHELCPFLSRDGKYLFYTSSQDIYWVNSGIIEQFRARAEN